MATGTDERLAEMERERARQNERWERARRALMQLGDAPIAVPREFLERLDALGLPPVRTGASAIRV
jgi:hypothetical protein